MRSRQDLCAAALSTHRQASRWTWLRGVTPIGPMISNRLGTALADVVPGTPAGQHQWDLVRDPERRVLWDALRSGSGSGYLDGPNQRSAPLPQAVPLSQLCRARRCGYRAPTRPRSLGCCKRLSALTHSLQPSAPSTASPWSCRPDHRPPLTAQVGGSASWRGSKRARWSATLHWLDEPSPTLGLIDFAPTDAIAGWFLARRLTQMPDPAQRTPALKAFGVDRAVFALRLRPVQEDAYGRLFPDRPARGAQRVCFRSRPRG